MSNVFLVCSKSKITPTDVKGQLDCRINYYLLRQALECVATYGKGTHEAQLMTLSLLLIGSIETEQNAPTCTLSCCCR